MGDSSSTSSIWRNQSYRHTHQNQLMLRQSKTCEKSSREEFQVLTLKADYQRKRKLLLGDTQCDHHDIKGCYRGQSKLGQGMFSGPDNAASKHWLCRDAPAGPASWESRQMWAAGPAWIQSGNNETLTQLQWLRSIKLWLNYFYKVTKMSYCLFIIFLLNSGILYCNRKWNCDLYSVSHWEEQTWEIVFK